MKHDYKGWIIIETTDRLRPKIYAEYMDESGQRVRKFFDSQQEAIDWWDKRVGEPIDVVPTLKGCYRVYVKRKGFGRKSSG